jgi:hypothetical protein
VWVIDDSEFAHADDLLRQFLQGDGARKYAHERWCCTHCNEDLEGQFTACWNCGNLRPESPAPENYMPAQPPSHAQPKKFQQT